MSAAILSTRKNKLAEQNKEKTSFADMKVQRVRARQKAWPGFIFLSLTAKNSNTKATATAVGSKCVADSARYSSIINPNSGADRYMRA